jgi:hypothetical protein
MITDTQKHHNNEIKNLIITSYTSLQSITRNEKREKEKNMNESEKIKNTNTTIEKPKPGTRTDVLTQLDQSRQPVKKKSIETPRKQSSTEDFIHLKGTSVSESSGQQSPEKKKIRTCVHQVEQATGVVPSHSTLDVNSEIEAEEEVQMVE